MIALYVFLVYLLGVVLAVFLAKLYNKKFKENAYDVISFGECFLSWLIVAVCLLVMGVKITIFLFEKINNWLK